MSRSNIFAALDEDYESTIATATAATATVATKPASHSQNRMQQQRSATKQHTMKPMKPNHDAPKQFTAQSADWNKPKYDRNHGGNHGKKVVSKEQEMITKFYKIYEKVDNIMKSSSGDLSEIEKQCQMVFESAPSKEEKAKTIEAIVSYSLHEIIAKDSYFGKIIASEMSINCKLGSIKERDGYDVFTWAIWTRINDKYFIRNLSRDNDDIIQTVHTLLQLNVSPFHMNSKKESFVGTMNACIPKRITQQTYDTIYNMIFVENVNPNLLIECCKYNLQEIFREGTTFSKSIVQWGLTIPQICEEILKEAFTHDLNYAGLGDVDRKNCEIVYHQVYFPKLIELCNSEPHQDLKKFFAENSVNKQEIVQKIADYYMQNMFKSYESIYEHDISFGSSGENRPGVCFKKLETFGAFMWEISQLSNPIYFDQATFNSMNVKVKLGYGIHGLNIKRANIQFLKDLYPETDTKSTMTCKFLLMGVCDKFGIQLEKKQIEVVKKVVEEKKVNHFEHFKVGLENIKSEIVEFEPKITSQSVDDAIYGMSQLTQKVSQEDFAREFVIKCMYELSTENQINHISPLIRYLDKEKILSKSSIRAFIETEECDEIFEDSKIDNPKATKLFDEIRASV